MRISIITAARNSESTIADAVRSVISQIHKDIEHIIIDGASEDGTLAALKPYVDRNAIIISEPDSGVYDAMNKGIAIAKGDIIGFLNADDMYADSEVLSRIAQAFDDPDIDGCYSDLLYVEKSDTNRILRYWKSGPYEEGCMKRGWIPPHPTFYVRRGVYEKYGLHDLDYKLAADFELMARFIVRHNIKLRYIDRVAVRMRLGGVTNKSFSNILKQNVEILRACRSNGIAINPATYIAHKVLMRMRQYRSVKTINERYVLL